MFTQIAMRELESNPNISHAKANKELGYESHPLKQIIDDTVDRSGLMVYLVKTIHN